MNARGASCNSPSPSQIAIYTDRLLKEEGVWKFKRRVLGSVPMTDLPAAAPSTP